MRSIEAIDFDARKAMINLAAASDSREKYDLAYRASRRIQQIEFSDSKALANLTRKSF